MLLSWAMALARASPFSPGPVTIISSYAKSEPHTWFNKKLERCTLRVLMVAMMKGATQTPMTSSNMGLWPAGWRGPSKPGVSENGFFKRSMTPVCVAAAAMVALKLAAVPPENVPFILRTRPRTRCAGLPKRWVISSCTINTPKSKGLESKPQEKTKRAPLFSAAAWCWSIM